MTLIKKILNDKWFMHSFRTALAVMISLAVAKLSGLAEFYWAPISAIIVMQSTLGQSWDISKQRLIGTFIGVMFAGVFDFVFSDVYIWNYTLGVFMLGTICHALKLTMSAYRLGGVTFTIILLMPHSEIAWRIGFDRFIEVTVGIVAALIVSAVGVQCPVIKQLKKEKKSEDISL
jgi:uncharacterized membrane protein YgaE (UPF0421/DUF939 family)